MKRSIAIFLALAMALSMFGCASSTTAPQQSAAAPASSAPASVAPASSAPASVAPASSAPASAAPASSAPASAAPASSEPASAASANLPAAFSKPLKIAFIQNDGSSDHASQMFEGAKRRAESLGMTLDTMLTNSDDVKMQDLTQQCVQSGYNGLILSHGKQEYSYDMVNSVVKANIPCVTFDTLPFNANKEAPAGITITQQDDYSLAKDSLNALLKYCKDTKNIDVPNIITNFYGPGVPPLDRRNEILQQYIAAGKVKVIDTVVATDPSNYIGDFQSKFGAMLNKYPKGSIDAFWSVADVYCQGCYLATEDAGRMGEFPFFSIDASDTDMDYMRKAGSTWQTCSAVDASLLGDVLVRILAMKIAGETTPPTYDFACQTFWKSDLKPDTNIVNLKNVIPGWGQSNDFLQPWMPAIQGAAK